MALVPASFITRKEQLPATKAYSEGWNLTNEWWFLQGLDPLVRAAWELNPKDGLLFSMHEFVTRVTRDRYPERLSPLLMKKGWAHTITTAPGTPPLRGLSLEIAFDATNDAYLSFVDQADAMLDAAYQNENLGLAGWFSLRFVGQSRAYLSPQHRFTRTCMVEIAALQELSHTRKLLAKLEDLGRQHGGIQHWGMFDDLRASDVAKAYPRLNTWRQVRWELTNGGTVHTFDNDFTIRCGLSSPPRPLPPKAGWAGWAGLGGAATQIATAVNHDGRIEVFAIGTDKALNHIWQSPSGGWSGWAGLGGGITQIATAVNHDGRIEVFAIGTDKALNHLWQSPGGGWSGWVGLGGGITQIATAMNQDGRIEVCAIGTDTALNHLWQTVPGG